MIIHVTNRYHDAGRLSDQQMALLQYQRENLHFLSEEVPYFDLTIYMHITERLFYALQSVFFHQNMLI